jgi:quercetin dioxygenase-like cupin family protein
MRRQPAIYPNPSQRAQALILPDSSSNLRQPTIELNEREWAMKAHRKRILTIIASIGALVAAALIIVPAQATPSSGVTTTILAKSLFDEIHVRAHGQTADRWKAQLKTHSQSDAYVVDNKFAPGGTTGWHSHPGPSLILVVAGTVTNYPGDDPNCPPHTYSKGDGFIDPGGGHLHLLRNETGTDAETIAVQLLPKGAPRRISAEAPSGCPS